MDNSAESRAKRTLEIATQLASLLEQHEVKSAVIGAMAMAAHCYPRLTYDFDLATDTDPFTKLRAVERALRQAGFEVELNEPEPDDPLGGVLRVTGEDFYRIDVVNFYNPWSRGCGTLMSEALQHAEPLPGQASLRVVSLPYLIALKLYSQAGRVRGKAALDVLELLERNREHLDLAAIRDVCHRHRLGAALEPLLEELGFEPPAPA